MEFKQKITKQGATCLSKSKDAFKDNLFLVHFPITDQKNIDVLPVHLLNFFSWRITVQAEVFLRSDSSPGKNVSFSGGVGQRIVLLLKPLPFVSEGCIYMLILS